MVSETDEPEATSGHYQEVLSWENLALVDELFAADHIRHDPGFSGDQTRSKSIHQPVQRRHHLFARVSTYQGDPALIDEGMRYTIEHVLPKAQRRRPELNPAALKAAFGR